MMEEAGAVGAAAWSAAARGWLTPAVLFVAINLVIATIAVASRLMSARGAGDDDEAAAGERRGLLLRAPSFLAADRLRSSFSFSRLSGLATDDHTQVLVLQPPASGNGAPETPSSLQQQQPAAAVNQQQVEDEHQREEAARIERSRSEAAAAEAPSSRRRPRVRARRAAPAEDEELDGHGGEEAAAVVEEVDARADDFIRRFREQLRLQRLDSILRYRDQDSSLRRTGTA